MNDVHAAASAGFGRAGDDYERGRPDYPATAREQLISTLGLHPGRVVLDLAAGTGKLTRALVATTTGVQVLARTAEQIPLNDSSVDAVTVAQAFHWFDVAAAAGEIHRVLRPHGRQRDDHDAVHDARHLVRGSLKRAGATACTPRTRVRGCRRAVFACARASAPVGLRAWSPPRHR